MALSITNYLVGPARVCRAGRSHLHINDADADLGDQIAECSLLAITPIFVFARFGVRIWRRFWTFWVSDMLLAIPVLCQAALFFGNLVNFMRGRTDFSIVYDEAHGKVWQWVNMTDASLLMTSIVTIWLLGCFRCPVLFSSFRPASILSRAVSDTREEYAILVVCCHGIYNGGVFDESAC
jgi:hypothetical protein